MGHAAGDELLRTVAERLRGRSASRTPSGVSAGTSSWSYSSTTRRNRDETLAERINVRPCGSRSSSAGESVLVTASIGIACGRYRTADELLRDADLALYQAKGQGKDRHAVFSASAEQTPVTA